MSTLIERLEKAGEGSRELDRAIFDYLREQPNFRDPGPLPHYTTNLQDALRLVPDGWKPSMISWLVECMAGPNDRVRASVCREKMGELPDGGYQNAHAASPALAFCAACLRALEKADG